MLGERLAVWKKRREGGEGGGAVVIPAFERFVGVDWSGAQGRAYSGIAVAECGAGTGAPVLVQPPTRRWRRTDFVDWVIGQASDERRMLIGIDCAFALPAAMATGLLGGLIPPASLWAHIDRALASAPPTITAAALRCMRPIGICSGIAGPRPRRFRASITRVDRLHACTLAATSARRKAR